MNTLHETTNVSSSSPDMDASMNGNNTSGTVSKSKTALKKEELDKIAKELKKKLLRATITAKQLSPSNLRTIPVTTNTNASADPGANGIHKINASPFKNPIIRKSYSSSGSLNNTIINESPVATRSTIQRHESTSNLVGANGSIFLSSSPSQLISPDGKSPTHIKAPGINLGSSPLKKVTSKYNTNESPTKKKGKQANNPQMILQQVQPPISPPKFGITTALVPPSSESRTARMSLNPPTSPPLSAHSLRTLMVPTTPTLSKDTLTSQGNPSISAGGASSRNNALLRTPTQGRHPSNYNDDEGADLLMYLATSPSPAKPFMQPNTPRATMVGGSSSSNALKGNGQHQLSNSGANSFLAPPPLTPKRHIGFSNGLNARTPQNRMTPAINLLLNINIPPSGVTSTPAGFNMNDYVNFLTPSPGVSLSSRMNPAKTPDFNSLLGATSTLSKKIGGSLANKGTGSRLSGEHLHSEKGSIVEEEDEHGETEPVDGKMINFDKVLFDSGDMPKSDS